MHTCIIHKTGKPVIFLIYLQDAVHINVFIMTNFQKVISIKINTWHEKNREIRGMTPCYPDNSKKTSLIMWL